MNQLGTMKNIQSSDQKGLKEIELKLKNKAFQMGLSTNEIMNEIRKGFYGLESQKLQIGTDEVKVWIRYSKEDRNSIRDLEQMRIKLLNKDYLVKDLTEITIKRGLVSLSLIHI